MHARAGTGDGVLNHTVSGRQWHNLWFNGTPVGETGINAALCGTWDCPAVLVSGDTAACRDGAELLGDGLVTVPVKQGLERCSARHLAPVRARALIDPPGTSRRAAARRRPDVAGLRRPGCASTADGRRGPTGRYLPAPGSSSCWTRVIPATSKLATNSTSQSGTSSTTTAARPRLAPISLPPTNAASGSVRNRPAGRRARPSSSEAEAPPARSSGGATRL